MTLIRAFFPFLSWTVMMMMLHCTADPLPPPTDLSFEWLDPFTVNVSWSWQRPSDLPEDCEIKFECAMSKDQPQTKRTDSRYMIDDCFTGEAGSQRCTYTVHAFGAKNCNDTSPSKNITVGRKSQGAVVKDFRCLVDKTGLNCSWIPVEPSQKLTLSHRTCGITEESRNTLRDCGQYYSSGERNGCYLQVPGDKLVVWVHVKTETAWSTFKAMSLVVSSPKLTITEDQGKLKLAWETLELGTQCLKYHFNYTQCNKPIDVYSTSQKVSSHSIPYDDRCLYQIQSRVVSSDNACPSISSDWSDVVTYGSNRPPDGTLTVVAIVIPTILFVCVILSCYCFRKHINILCPIIPDPSAIFKEMMMNGNKDQRPGNLYTPVPEPVEPCKITLVTENSIIQ